MTKYNPKYAHMLFQIFRTYFNFVNERDSYDKKKLTPAQRIGVAKKKYDLRDIIYYR